MKANLKRKKARCAAFSHASRRAKERYNLTLKYQDYKTLCRRIQYKWMAVFLWDVGRGRTAWQLEHPDTSRPLVVLWDKDIQSIITFLPITALKMKEGARVRY